MTIGTTYIVSDGTLTIRSISGGKDRLYTLWHEARNPKYSCEVTMSKEHVRRIDKLKYKTK